MCFLPYQKPNRQATEQKPNLAINHFPLNQLESHGFCCWSPEQSPNLHGPASRKRVTAPQTRSASSMAWMGIRWDQFTEKMRISGSKMADFMESILLGGAIACNNHLEKYESQWEGLAHVLWKIKNVWNHQPDILHMLHILIYILATAIRMGNHLLGCQWSAAPEVWECNNV